MRELFNSPCDLNGTFLLACIQEVEISLFKEHYLVKMINVVIVNVMSDNF